MTATQKDFSHSLGIGDVVTLQDRVELMTVEGVRHSAFGTVLDCCWFDGNDALRYASHPVQSLDVFPKPSPETSRMEIGTEVRLRSRGPVMTIRGFRTRDRARFALCAWTGPMGRERQRLFPVHGLVLTMLERFAGLADGSD